MISFELKIMGRVQGVGFRPFVYRLAHHHSIKGEVQNGNSGVWIRGSGSKQSVSKFCNYIIQNAPPSSVITSHSIQQIPFVPYDDFKIISSIEDDESRVLISPDFSMCKECEKEVQDRSDNRFDYPFITCTDCGPRYSIIENIPYDRPNITMSNFRMCPNCLKEYHNPLDRRYYSQTNSCPVCGPQLALYPLEKTISSDLISFTIKQLQKGKILAVKGIGGYLLLADATNEQAINKIRKRKRRPQKPFALLYPDIDTIKKDCLIHAEEVAELESLSSPICLLKTLPETSSGVVLKDIAPGLRNLGIMLPYAPLLYLISKEFSGPLIATSGNISGSPIIYENEVANEHLFGIADHILHHNRDITIAQDDSVVQFSSLFRTKILLRRSRGIAPNFFCKQPYDTNQNILSTGADLKGSIAMLHQGQMYISQFLGELNNLLAQESLDNTLAHWKKLYNAHHDTVLTDLHPGYHSVAMGKEIAQKSGAALIMVPHHLAHFSAILGEHQLWDNDSPVLGCIWDGTGYGLDGQNWGGEFFSYHEDFNREYHLEYVKMLPGDVMAREPRIMGLLFSEMLRISIGAIDDQFTPLEKKILLKRITNTVLQSSSMGRLFDGIAALLGIIYFNTHEGEAAMKLQFHAEQYARRNNYPSIETYPIHLTNNVVEIKPIIHGIIYDLQANMDLQLIAYKFHFSCVRMIQQVADSLNIGAIAFSGGVFQNALLVDLIQNQLVDYTLYFHQQLPANDENISYGQIEYFLHSGVSYL
jgi:hydrogenase maturation protein HypF